MYLGEDKILIQYVISFSRDKAFFQRLQFFLNVLRLLNINDINHRMYYLVGQSE